MLSLRPVLHYVVLCVYRGRLAGTSCGEMIRSGLASCSSGSYSRNRSVAGYLEDWGSQRAPPTSYQVALNAADDDDDALVQSIDSANVD